MIKLHDCACKSLCFLHQEAANTLGFSADEKLSMYKVCASCMHWGNAKFKQRPREEQAEVADPKGICVVLSSHVVITSFHVSL